LLLAHWSSGSGAHLSHNLELTPPHNPKRCHTEPKVSSLIIQLGAPPGAEDALPSYDDMVSSEHNLTDVRRRKLKVGNRVSVAGYGTGTVRYFGKHAHKKHNRVGVELDQPVGLNNGTIDGHVYFVCEEGYGVLVVPSKAVRLPASTTVV
jgi:hypothetical protein